ncbi:MAG: PQQ-binding-like beta-propeller repeat protein [Armatimonadetes bacterium]|nr:PQQ-binding-like beta-propeller repeat protein [Armatimonadota bacterium]
MRILTLILGLMLANTAAGAAGSDMKQDPITTITTLKTQVPDTLIVENGVARAEIVVPDVSEYRELGKQVQDAVKSATGAELAVRTDSEVASKYGVLEATPSKSIVLLGNMETSNLASLLYARKLICEDALYPGKGGYTVRTINDPWGNGANVILLGGSDLDGVSRAVEAFGASMPRGSTMGYSCALRIVLGAELAARFKDLVTEPTDAEIAEQIKAADKAFRAGAHTGVMPYITNAGAWYLRTGRDGYARLFREMVFLAHDLYKQNLGTYGGPWGMDADFRFADFIATWDSVEESPALSDDDRLRIVNIILEYIRYWESYWSITPVLTPGLRNNHTTFTSLGFMFAADYFAKYYDLPQASHWTALADGCFQSQARSFKPQEDSNSYQWITLNHMMTYALARPDPSYITSGNARIGADLAIMTMDNLGYQVSFGDVGSFHGGNIEMYLWRSLAAMERDGRYMWAYLKGNEVRPNAGMSAYQNSVEPSEPRDLLGVKWLPTDPMFYAHHNGSGTVPQKHTFEKISFRTSFDVEKPYLLLDGISGCGHGHSDGNSVLRFSDKGRIWLADCDYIKSQPKYHNMITVYRDGQSFPLPTFSEREIVADLGRVAFTRTTTPGCSGADWSRNILWDKGDTFVFMDKIEAKVADEFSVRCFWQALGQPEMDGSSLTVKQNGPAMTIHNLDGSRLRTWDDPVIGKNWSAYKQAEPIIRVLQQIKTKRMDAAESICFMNVVSTQKEGAPPVEAERVSDTSILLGSGRDRSLVGIGSGSKEIAPGISTDGAMYWLNGGCIAVGQATMLALSNRTVFSTDNPVSVELEPGGRVTVSTDEPATTRIAAGKDGLRLGGKHMKGKTDGGLTSVFIPAGRSVIEGAALPAAFAIKFPRPKPAERPSAATATDNVKKLMRSGGFRAAVGTEKLVCLASDTDGVCVGSDTGRVYAVSADGTAGWTFDADSEIKALWISKLAKDEPKRIAVGTAGSTVYLLDENGNQLWKQELPYYKRDAKVVYFSSADLWGDGNRALIAGSENWHHYAFDSKGAQLWKYESVHASTAGTPTDLDGDGREEYIAGTEYYWWHGVSPTGERLWQYRTPTGPRATCVVAGRIMKDAAPTVLFGGADGNIHAVDADGTSKWRFNTGDEITGIALCDLDGDGLPEIVAGSLSFSVCAVSGDGRRVWRRDIEEPVRALVAADMDGDGRDEICVGGEDGRIVVLDREGRVTAEWRASSGVKALSVISGARDKLACITADGTLTVLGDH